MEPTNNIQNILLVYGGTSREHDISCRSVQFVYSILKKLSYNVIPLYISKTNELFYTKKPIQNPLEYQHLQKYTAKIIIDKKIHVVSGKTNYHIDFIFPMIHGTQGEDGSLSGLAEFLRLPYAGTSIATSSICMNKHLMKDVFQKHKIPQLEYFHIHHDNWKNNKKDIIKEIHSQFEYPIFAKPCNTGSSVGVYKIQNEGDLIYIEKCFLYDSNIIIEQGREVRELEIAIIGSYPNYQTSTIGEIQSHGGFYSYHAKYIDPEGAKLLIPANISDSISQDIHSIAKKSFAAVGGEGFSRIDFFLDKKTNLLYLNEINTVPGFTDISMFPKLWQAQGESIENILKKIIDIGCDKYHQQSKYAL